MQAKALAEIIRPLNCLMAALGVFVGYSIALGNIVFVARLGIAMAVAFLVCAGGITLNDVFDAEIDKKLFPEKPIPSKRISKKTALYYSTALFVFANLFALYCLPVQAFAIAFAFTILFVLYSKCLAKVKYLGNWVVASGTAFTLLFGASLTGNYSIVAFFALAALLANAAREITKDIEDLAQDKGFKVSLPMVSSVNTAKKTLLFCTVLAILVSYVPFFLGFGGIVFILILSIANANFVFSAKKALQNDYAKAQRAFKGAMLLALLAFLSGAVA